MDKPSYQYMSIKKSGHSAMNRPDIVSYIESKYITPSTTGFIDFPFKQDESDIVKRYKVFIPGKIYTFLYTDIFKEKPTDKHPVMLSLYNYTRKSDKMFIEVGINLNLLPPPARLAILDSLWSYSKKIIELNESTIFSGGTNQKPIPLFDYSVLNRLFNKIAKVPFEFAIQGYIKTKIKYPKIVSYEDWCLLIDYVPKTLIGTSISTVWKEYSTLRESMLKEVETPKHFQKEQTKLKKRSKSTKH